MNPAFPLTRDAAHPQLQSLLNRPAFLSRTLVTRLHDVVPRTYDPSYFSSNYLDSTNYPIGYDTWREVGRSNGTAGGTVAYAKNQLVAVPFVVNAPFRIEKIQFRVTTGGAAGSKARVGIYDSVDDRGGFVGPGRLLVDGGEYDSTATGVKTTTLTTPIDPEPGRVYWCVYVCGTNAPTVRSVPVGAAAYLSGSDGTMPTNATICALRCAFTYAALPGAFPAALNWTYEVADIPAIQIHTTRAPGWTNTSYLHAHAPIEGGTLLRRARLMPMSDLVRTSASTRDASIRVACGLRSRTAAGAVTFEALGREFDSRVHDLKAGLPFDLVTDEAAVATSSSLAVRVIQTGWPAMALGDAAVEWTLGYEGGA